MIRPHRSLVPILLVATGVFATAIGLSHLREENPYFSDRNPFAIQKSAYGKLLARLSETTVDRVWHLGVEQIAPHKFEDHLPEQNQGLEHPSDLPEDHLDDPDSGEADASEGEGDVFVYVVGEDDELEDVKSECHSSEGACECESCKLLAEAANDFELDTNEPFMPQAKKFLGRIGALKYLRTNPYSMSEAHVAWAKKEVEELLLRSYKLDPLHYGAYNSYHLFLTTHDFGGSDLTLDRARLISQLTIQEAFAEKEDPVPYLTAASALLNLYFMDWGVHQTAGTKIPVEDLRKYRADIAYCLGRFNELQQAAERDGVWQNLSTEVQLEIAERARFAARTFEQFDVQIARAEGAAVNKEVEEEVAELLEVDGISR